MLKTFKLEEIKSFDISKLENLSCEVRDFIIQEVSKTGGHLGASLGVVELTVALHYVFSSPIDAIIWDIGHQSYAHKLLTGRVERFNTIRTFGGLSGFTNPLESKHDHFFAGHSSTSISLGVGVASAKILNKDPSYTISIIGDGAISAGMAFEGMNNVETAGKRFITILNDNDMSISSPTGAISRYLPKLFMSYGYQGIKNISKKFLSKFPNKVFSLCQSVHKSFKGIVNGGNLFEELGYEYVGPVDGHNLRDVIKILETIKQNATKPVLLHVITKKGKGYKPAENAEDKFHGVKPFNIETGKQSSGGGVSCSKFIANLIENLAKEDEKITAITPAMCQGSALQGFKGAFPDRFFDVGIAEQHAVTFSAGQAQQGLKPFCFLYSTFLQRSYDQIIHDVVIQSLSVCFIVDRSGLTGEDGVTHHGIFDVPALRVLPNVEICNVFCENSMKVAVDYSKNVKNPFFIRIPKENTQNLGLNYFPHKATVVQEGTDGLLVASGRFIKLAKEAEKYQNWKIVDPFFFKPLPAEVVDFIADFKKVEILEEGVVGGLASIILETCHQKGISTKHVSVKILPDVLIHHGKNSMLWKESGVC